MTFQHYEHVAAEPHYVGIAIRATPLGERSMHVGLLYRHSGGDVRFAHLAWHNALKDEPLPLGENYFWAECEPLAQEDPLSEFVADFIEVCAQTKEIPYGPKPPEEAFDSSGRYCPQDVREGLTCATFVSSVLASAGFPVVQLDTWESRPDDAVWWSSMFGHLKESVPARAEELKGLAIEFRLRPDEIAVAATSADPPLVFQAAVARSAPLQDLLFSPTVADRDSVVSIVLPAGSMAENDRT